MHEESRLFDQLATRGTYGINVQGNPFPERLMLVAFIGDQLELEIKVDSVLIPQIRLFQQ